MVGLHTIANLTTTWRAYVRVFVGFDVALRLHRGRGVVFKKSVWIVILFVVILVAITAGAFFRAESVGTKAIEPVQTPSDADDHRSAPKCGLVKVFFVALGGLCTASHQVLLDPVLARGIHDAGIIRDAGVRRLRIGIDRGVLDALADLPSPELCHGVGFIPDQESGRRSLRLIGVRDGTLLAFLGIQNEDRLETLEGFDVTESALAAYAHLCTAERLTLRLNRGGEPLDIVYDVQ